MARLDGTTQNDELIWSDAESVEIYGYAGNDSLRGGQGNDIIYGNTGQDSLGGNTGNDTLYGGRDNDSIFAASGTDQLFGDKGDDYLVATSGNGDRDTLTGGEGNDTFTLINEGGPAIITDFNSSSDFLQLVVNDFTNFVFRVSGQIDGSFLITASNNGGFSFDTTLAILTNYTGDSAGITAKTTLTR